MLFGQGNAQVSSDLSSEIRRLLQLCEEEDDATSKLAELPPVNPKPEPLDVPEPDVQSLQDERIAPTFQQVVCSAFPFLFFTFFFFDEF